MVETVIFYCMSPQCDLDLEDRKPVFRLTLWPMMVQHNTNLPSLVMKGSNPDDIQTKTETLTPLLWPWPQQSSLCDTLAYDDVLANEVWLQSCVQLDPPPPNTSLFMKSRLENKYKSTGTLLNKILQVLILISSTMKTCFEKASSFNVGY